MASCIHSQRNTHSKELQFQPLGSTGALTRTLLRNDDVPSDAILVSLPGFPLLQNQTASMLFVS